MSDPSPPLTPAEVCSELNRAGAKELVALASRCLNADPDVVVTRPPTVGTVVTQVREPVAEQRFILGDVLVCGAEVTRRGRSGWAMRMGSDQLATLAAAICAAEFESDGPHAADVVALCLASRQRRRQARADEWERLAPSIVEFEEIP